MSPAIYFGQSLTFVQVIVHGMSIGHEVTLVPGQDGVYGVARVLARALEEDIVDEHEESSALRIFAEVLASSERQAIERSAHVLGLRADEDPRGQRDHDGWLVSAATTWRSVSGRKPSGTRMTAPLSTTISIRSRTTVGVTSLAFTSTNFGAERTFETLLPVPRASFASRHFQYVSVLGLTPSSAANSATALTQPTYPRLPNLSASHHSALLSRAYKSHAI
jgi:hypothetical protein